MTLNGLVLAGGRSTRMGHDKGLLEYYRQPHRFYLADLLQRHCAQVYISINPQQPQLQSEKYAYLVDAPDYVDMGPPGALLSAHAQLPEVSWLIVSCDLPFFNEDCVRQLIDQRAPDKDATAFLNPDTQQPEPLVAIYERAFLGTLPEIFHGGEKSLRRVLSRADVNLVHLIEARCIQSADQPDELAAAMHALRLASGHTNDPPPDVCAHPAKTQPAHESPDS